jgi:type I restriction enzyme M protein
VLARLGSRETTELERPRTEQSFCVPEADIVTNGYDLSINRYKEVVHEVVEHRSPKDIMAKLAELEDDIQAGMKKLESMLS